MNDFFINKGLQDKRIYPLVFMISLEPINFKEKIHTSITKAIFQHLQNAKFSLHFTVFGSPFQDTFEVTFALESLDAKMFPVMITDIFKDLSNKRVKEFISYPFRLFKPFKKAILAFEDRPYTIEEFNPIMKDWRKSLNKIKI
jgi:hypothetical protein